MADTDRNDWRTIGALALLAACLVTFDHEALGHGGACLALHGRILRLTSSIFHCSARSAWIDPAGPASNLVMGAIALALSWRVPRGRTALRLFLLLVGAFSWFWESGYLARAMLRRDGDLYFFARAMLGELSPVERWTGFAVGILLFIATARVVSAGLLKLWPDARIARGVGRTAWLCATAGAAIAALGNTGHDWGDLRDAVLEIGGASFPLLFLPLRGGEPAGAPVAIGRSWPVIGLAVVVFALFVLTLGRGVSA